MSSLAAAVRRASSAPATSLPHGALDRAFELLRGAVTPYQREVYRVLLEQAMRTLDVRTAEEGLYAEHGGNFYDYAWHGARLLTLLARRSPVAQFALKLGRELARQSIDVSTLALGSEVELFPELFDNAALTEAQSAYLQGQLNNEYEVVLTHYVRLLLHSIPVSEIPADSTVLQPDLVPLLQRIVAGEEIKPCNAAALRRRYAAQIALLKGV